MHWVRDIYNMSNELICYKDSRHHVLADIVVKSRTRHENLFRDSLKGSLVPRELRFRQRMIYILVFPKGLFGRWVQCLTIMRGSLP